MTLYLNISKKRVDFVLHQQLYMKKMLTVDQKQQWSCFGKLKKKKTTRSLTQYAAKLSQYVPILRDIGRL